MKLYQVLKDKFQQKFSNRVNCIKINTIAYRDLLELLRDKDWVWIDSCGVVSSRQKILKAFLNLCRDTVFWPYFIIKVSVYILGLQIKKVKPILNNQRLSLIFLRTDHWFNVKSGGSVGHLSGVINGFSELDNQIYVISSDQLENISKEIKIYVCEPVYQLGRNLPNIPEILYNFTLFKWIGKHITKLNPSLIYQRYSLGNFTGVLLKHRYRIPYICEYNGSFPWMARNWEGRKIFHEKLITKIELLNLKVADVIVVVSQSMKDELTLRGICPEKILVNPNGVNPEQYSPDIDPGIIRQKYNIENKIVLGFIGTFGKWHGAEVLTEAYGLLLKQYPIYRGKICLFMIGDGPTMSQVKEKIKQYGIENESILTGMIPQSEGPLYLAACDILVAPHVPNPDGTPFFGSPTKLFEYMAMGKGIVASNLDQIGEILIHDYTAWLVNPGNIDSLVLGLKLLIDDEQRRLRLGKAAHEEVIARYTWREHTRKIIEKLRERCSVI